jgi:Zn-dependent alcohol dehydrogenase
MLRLVVFGTTALGLASVLNALAVDALKRVTVDDWPASGKLNPNEAVKEVVAVLDAYPTNSSVKSWMCTVNI